MEAKRLVSLPRENENHPWNREKKEENRGLSLPLASISELIAKGVVIFGAVFQIFNFDQYMDPKFCRLSSTAFRDAHTLQELLTNKTQRAM